MLTNPSLVVKGQNQIGQQQSREPVAFKTGLDEPGGGNLCISMDGRCHLVKREHMDVEIEFGHHPDRKGNIAHEVVNKLQVIYTSMTR